MPANPNYFDADILLGVFNTILDKFVVLWKAKSSQNEANRVETAAKEKRLRRIARDVSNWQVLPQEDYDFLQCELPPEVESAFWDSFGKATTAEEFRTCVTKINLTKPKPKTKP